MPGPISDEIYWRILVPGTDWQIYEGMIDPVNAKLILAFVIWGICCLGTYAFYRFDNWLKSDRSKSREE